jgi:hypothetical protein
MHTIHPKFVWKQRHQGIRQAVTQEKLPSTKELISQEFSHKLGRVLSVLNQDFSDVSSTDKNNRMPIFSHFLIRLTSDGGGRHQYAKLAVSKSRYEA